MDRAYQGLKEDGTWEQFVASSPEEATPEITGYEKVEEIKVCKCPPDYHTPFENCRPY